VTNNTTSSDEDDLRELYDESPCGYISWLPDGTITRVNRAILAWTGYTSDELLDGKKLQDLLPVPQKIYYETHYAPLLQIQGFIKEVALELLCRGRDPLPVLVNSRFHPAAERRVAHVRGIFFDATDRRRYERHLLDARRSLEETVMVRTSELESQITEKEAAEESLKQLTSKLLQLRDDERRRIARDLHDSAGQLLAGATMNLELALKEKSALSREASRALNECGDLIRETLKEIRIVSYLLHPPLLDESGLQSALEWFLEGFSKRSGVEAHLVIDEDFGRLPMDMETAIFRIIQESMTNVHRHSGSKTAMVRLSRTLQEIIAEIRDEGVGIPAELSQGVGLRGMRERVRQFRGSLDIKSSHPGTRLTARFPAPIGDWSSDSIPFS
jgi:PAS domain S-box-containing protein